MRLSIINKFVFGLLIIFGIGYIVMSFFINNIIVENNKMIIKKNLLPFQRDLSLYIKQYFELKESELSINNFIDNAENIASELSFKVDDRIIVYSYDGEFLFDSANAKGQILNYEDMDIGKRNVGDEDLRAAINNKSAFIIVPVNRKYIAVFSCPIINNGKRIGIIRCVKDYSEIFSSNSDLLEIINIFIIIVFGSIFLFVALLATKITKPIVKLSRATKEVAKGNFETNISIDSRDEIGNLAMDFDVMKEKIKNQIEIIKTDRDSLQKLEGYRKNFFDNITHEMKTPLTIISGYAQILIDNDFKDHDFLRKSITKINYETDLMHKMILKLLEISKLESEVKSQMQEFVDLSKIINNACDDMKIKADKYEISIEKDIEGDIYIYGNTEELRSVIINLIDNSIKYGFVKTCIKIKIYQEDQSCRLVVEDRGKGIPRDKLEKIFDPFYRVDKGHSRKNDSYGLGLAIVKKIISKYNGEIKILSQEQIGTKVCIKIPLKVYKSTTSV